MFNEAERKIFGPYLNGVEMVHGDPLRIYRRLHFMLDGEVNKYLQQARSEDASEKFHAWEKLIPAVVFAFEMVEFDKATGKGSLEQDAKAVLRAYLEFMDSKKETGPTLQTCSLPSQAGPIPRTTAPTWPSGATSVGFNSARPGQ